MKIVPTLDLCTLVIRNDVHVPNIDYRERDNPNQPPRVKINLFVHLNKTQTFDIKFIIIKLL